MFTESKTLKVPDETETLANSVITILWKLSIEMIDKMQKLNKREKTPQKTAY